MDSYSRRKQLERILPVLAGAAAMASTARGQSKRPPVKQGVYHSSKIAYQGDETTKQKKGRQFFRGVTHTGFEIEVHETALGPGVATHEPHRHAHEEVILVLEGAVEAFIEGKTEVAETGSIIYFESNKLHTMKAAGSAGCRYCVMELRGSGD